MDLSSSVIRIIVLAQPGILSALLYWRLRGRVGRKDWEDFLEIGVFLLFIYLIYSASISLLIYLGFTAYPPKTLEALTDDKLPIPWTEIPEASVVGIVLAVLAAYVDKYNLINRIGRKIKASNRLNDKDLWEAFFHHSKIGWVCVIDHKVNFLYVGWAHQYSDTEKIREIILGDVKIYNNDGYISSSPLMYVSRDKHDLTIEFIAEDPTNKSSKQTKEALMAEKQKQNPAIKIINPPQIIDPPGSDRKGQENTNPKTPRPEVEPNINRLPKNDKK